MNKYDWVVGMAKVTGENLTPQHVKAARALLDWSANQLAKSAAVGISTIKVFESGKPVRESSKQAMIDALDHAGVELLNGGRIGARLKGDYGK